MEIYLISGDETRNKNIYIKTDKTGKHGLKY